MLNARLASFGICGLMSLCPLGAVYAADAPSVTRPGWLAQGNASVTHDTGRAIYGVGAVAAAADNRDLRQQAEAKAQDAALAQLDAFAVAVQADGSPQGRAMATGVQAFRPLLAQLVRKMDHYVGADGTHYALAAIQANSLQAVVDKARAKGLTLEALDAASFEAQFDKVAHVDAAAAAVIADGDSSWADAAPKQDMAKVPRALGPEPAWAKATASASLPASIYVCGRGHGSNVSAAVGAGAAALTGAFLKQGESAAQDLQAALQPLGLGDVRGGDVKAAAKEAWGTLQPLLLGTLQWTDKGGRVTAATCLPRVKAYIASKDALKSLDTQVSEALAAATSAAPDSAEKKDNLARSWRRLQVREAAAAMLRTVNVSGLGQRGPHSLSDVAAAANPVPKPPRLAVSADGPYWLGLANALVDGTRSAGVVPALAAVAPTYDLHLTATVTLAKADNKGRTSKNTESATASVVLHLQDMRAGKVLLHETYSANGSANSNVFDAERAAMRALAQTAVQATRHALLGHTG